MYKTIQKIFPFSFSFPVPFLWASASLNSFAGFSPASKAENAANAESSFNNVVEEHRDWPVFYRCIGTSGRRQYSYCLYGKLKGLLYMILVVDKTVFKNEILPASMLSSKLSPNCMPSAQNRCEKNSFLAKAIPYWVVFCISLPKLDSSKTKVIMLLP